MLKPLCAVIVCSTALFGMMMPPGVYGVPMPSSLRMDYTEYNQLSIVLKKFGWLEQEFKADNLPVSWIYRGKGEDGIKYLAKGTVDFVSVDALGAFISKANGHPVKTVYMFSRPEWTMLLVTRDSPYNSLVELKGKKIAALTESYPWYFLLRALHKSGLRKGDVTILPLQLPDGRTALEELRVDAWVGAEPFIATSRLESGFRAIYRNPEYNSSGFLNTTEAFAAKYPEVVARVVRIYEMVRKWAIRHPDELAEIYADETGISLPVAQLIISQIDLSRPLPNRSDLKILMDAAPLLEAEKLIKQGTAVERVVGDLVDFSYLTQK
ncbi:aliphatic sulfonate ABC transporter substrate-binding protein [Chlorobium sp. BLA1]|nr:aliphatic sulfonate ABC transporter substrate-binding protein [Candidatus Chlorobium masyuteum]NTU44029.1 aliphatic sulfonate ABC transporter substrate-binding protein [Chlorobiaceae bacterium]